METVFNVEIPQKDLHELVKNMVVQKVTTALQLNTDHIEGSIKQYFTKTLFNNKISQFESAIDWAVEDAFRIGINKAMEELNFHELIAQEAKKILMDNNFIRDLAEAKVRKSLGL